MSDTHTEVDTQPLPPTESAAAPVASPPEKEPPRALAPGAFLHGEFEIKEVIARGWTNLYLADAGGYGAPALKIIAEREIVAPQVLADAPVVAAPLDTALSAPLQTAPVETAPQVLADAPVETPPTISSDGLTDYNEMAQGAESGAMHREADLYDAPSEILPEIIGAPENLTPDEKAAAYAAEIPAAQINQLVVSTPATSELPTSNAPQLVVDGEKWTQDEREYCVWEWVDSTSLQDFRGSTNDEQYLQVLATLANGLKWAHANEKHLDVNRDTLRVLPDGTLRYFGFVGEKLANGPTPLDQLAGANEFLLKHVFANSGTMRLDDQFAGLALSEETKSFAHRLNNDEFTSFEAACDALQVLAGETKRPLRARAALATDVGMERELNEDSGLIARMSRATHLTPLDWEIYVVADGMGGHEGGEVASDLTIRSLQDALHHANWNWDDNAEVKNALVGVIDEVNAKVASLAEDPKHKNSRSRPGSTLTFALRSNRRVWVGNVGDSRAYKFANGQLERITKDHSYVQTLIDAGSLSEEDAWDHPEGSIITAHIGEARLRTRDVFVRLFSPGDMLLIVSDGVIDMLRDRDIAPILQAQPIASTQPETVCQNLIDAANANGGADNITVVCVIFE